MVSKSKLRSPFTQIPSQLKATAAQVNVRKRSMNPVPNSGGRVAPNCTRILPSNVNLKLLALHLMAKCHPQPCTFCDQRYHHTGLSHDCLAVRTLTPASSSPGQCSQPSSLTPGQTCTIFVPTKPGMLSDTCKQDLSSSILQTVANEVKSTAFGVLLLCAKLHESG